MTFANEVYYEMLPRSRDCVVAIRGRCSLQKREGHRQPDSRTISCVEEGDVASAFASEFSHEMIPRSRDRAVVDHEAAARSRSEKYLRMYFVAQMCLCAICCLDAAVFQLREYVSISS